MPSQIDRDFCDEQGDRFSQHLGGDALPLPWRAVQTLMRTIVRKYMGHDTGEIETWLRNIIVLLPKIRTTITLQWTNQRDLHTEHTGQMGLRLPRTTAQHVTQRTMYQRLGHPRHLHAGREEGQSADEISTTLNFWHRTAHA